MKIRPKTNAELQEMIDRQHYDEIRKHHSWLQDNGDEMDEADIEWLADVLDNMKIKRS